MKYGGLNWLYLCTVYFRVIYRPIRKIKEKCFCFLKVFSHNLATGLQSHFISSSSMCYFLSYSSKCDRLALTNSISGNLTLANFGFPLIHTSPLPNPAPSNCIALWGMLLKVPSNACMRHKRYQSFRIFHMKAKILLVIFWLLFSEIRCCRRKDRRIFYPILCMYSYKHVLFS
jgi:hypothetical protein